MDRTIIRYIIVNSVAMLAQRFKCSYKSLIDAGIFLAVFLFEFNNFQYDLGLVVFNVRNLCSNFFLDCCLAFDIHFLHF